MAITFSLRTLTTRAKKVADIVKDKGGNVKEKLKALEIGEKIKDKVDDAISMAKKVGVPWILLLPLKPQMRAALKFKGITPPDEIGELAQSFYNNVVKRSSFDSAVDNDRDGFAHFAEVERSNFVLSAAAISTVVAGIVEFISSIKKKKEEGKALSKTETVINDVSTTAENAINDKVENDVNQEIGATIIKYLPWVVGVIVLLFVAKKMKMF